jgi:hypothetical protein
VQAIAAAWSTWAAANVVAAWIITKAVQVAAFYGVSRALTPSARMNTLTTSGTQVNVRDPAAAHRVIYGQREVAGIVYPLGTSGSSSEYLTLAVLIASHECQELGTIKFDGVEIPLDGSGNATGTFAGYVRIKKKLGTYNQTVDSDTQTDLTAGFWPSTCTFAGRAVLLVRLKHNPDLFPTGIPNITCLVKGRKVYDPRDGGQSSSDPSTWVWSANAALCAADWLMGVPMKNESGTVIRPYGVKAGVNADIMTALASAMSGDVVCVGGTWLIRAGAYRTAESTALTLDDLRAPIDNIDLLPPSDQLCNGVKGTYVSSLNNWQPADFPGVVNSTYTTEDGGERIWRDIALPFTTSAPAAQRLAKIQLEDSRQPITFKARCKLTCLRYQCLDVVPVTIAALGWSSKVFKVVDFELTQEADKDGNPVFGCDLTLKETASGIYTWSAEETTVDLAPNTSLPDPYTVPTPGAPTLTSGATTALQKPDGTVEARLKVAWTAPTNSFVSNGGRVWIEYKKSADSDWITWANDIRGDQTFDYILGLHVGVNYDVRIRFENVYGVRGAYATTTAHSFTGNAVTPSAPGAATKTAEGTYTAGDGTVLSYLTFTLPAMPAGAAKQWLLFKKSSETEYTVGAGPFTNTGNLTGVTLMDLTPGIIYTVALIAISSLDVPSVTTAATGSPFTAPGKTDAPPTPVGANSYGGTFAAGNTNENVLPVFTSSGVRRFVHRFRWSESAASDPSSFGGYIYPADFDHWEVKGVATDSAAATDYNVDDGQGLAGIIKTKGTATLLACTAAVQTYIYLRAVNTSGVACAWTRITDVAVGFWVQQGGNAMEKNTGTSSGTVAAGDDSRITGAAQKSSNLSDLASAATALANLGGAAKSANLSDLGSAATARGNLGLTAVVTKNVRVGSVDVTLSGGSPSETFDIDLTGLGYAAKPAAGFLACIDPTYVVSYDKGSGSSTNTNARCTIKSTDGTNIPATTTPIMFCFTD